jgi:hypothetical protein
MISLPQCISCGDKMKNQKCDTIGTVPKLNRKIVEIEAKSIPLKCIYMTAHIHGLVQALQ